MAIGRTRSEARVAAALLALAVVAAQPAVLHAQDRASFAQQRFQHANELFDAQHYDAALDEFRASYALYASPNSLMYAARCLRALGRLDEAVLEFDRAAREAEDRAQGDPRYAETASAARAGVSALTGRVARLHVTVSGPPADAVVRVSVNGRAIPHEALAVAVPVMPGHLRVVAAADGFVAGTQELDLEVGHEGSVQLALAPVERAVAVPDAPAPAPPRVVALPARDERGAPRALAAAFVALGAVGFAGSGLAWWQASERFGVVMTACPGFACNAPQTAAISAGQTWQALTNVALGVGAGGLALGAVFLVWALLPARAPSPPATVAIGRDGVAITGAF